MYANVSLLCLSVCPVRILYYVYVAGMAWAQNSDLPVYCCLSWVHSSTVVSREAEEFPSFSAFESCRQTDWKEKLLLEPVSKMEQLTYRQKKWRQSEIHKVWIKSQLLLSKFRMGLMRPPNPFFDNWYATINNMIFSLSHDNIFPRSSSLFFCRHLKLQLNFVSSFLFFANLDK